MSGLTKQEISEFREIFDLVDKDKGGSISKEELSDLMDTLGINASAEEIDLMINEIDDDNNGEIDFDEFVAVMSRKVNATYTADDVKQSFKLFEKPDGQQGHVDKTALEHGLSTYSTKGLSEAEIAQLVAQLCRCLSATAPPVDSPACPTCPPTPAPAASALGVRPACVPHFHYEDHLRLHLGGLHTFTELAMRSSGSGRRRSERTGLR